MNRCVAIALLIAAALSLTAQAQASKTQQSIFQDDRLLQNLGLNEQALALDEMKGLGVNTIHAVINWNTLAPDPASGSIPAGFVGTDPNSYSEERWGTIDQLVRGAQQRGMDVILTPAAPAPNWAIGKDCTTTERRRAPKGTCRPNPKLYGDFVTALAKRYSGTYVDASQPAGTIIPRVRRWSIWNEPNLNSWIYPSLVSIRGKWVPVSAKIYRDLVYAAGNALHRNGHASDQILLGETAPIGQGSVRTSPADFYRALFCVSATGKRLRGTAAKQLGCPRRIKRLPVTGIAHHPYTKGAAQRLTSKQHSNDITISNIPLLRKVLGQGVKAGAISRGTASQIYFTEFGVSSTPPAKPRSYGVPLARQAEWINEFEYLSWLNPAVRSTSQFQLEDDTLMAGSGGSKIIFQTGLRFPSPTVDRANPVLGKAKPAWFAYKVPLFVVDHGRKLTIWGGVRGVKSGRVKVLNGSRTVKTVALRRGFFSITVARRKGTWRLSYRALKSRVAKPVKLR